MNIFEIAHQSDQARVGRLTLADGQIIETPIFMPVGTQATVKALTPLELEQLGVRMILCNAYHLYLRPGTGVIAEMGGLHHFMNWKGGIITDSGGYQVFSLSDLRKLRPEGIEFTSHLDGSKHLFTPENNMELQHALGANICMALDVCAPYPASTDEIKRSVELTSAWAKRCLRKHEELGGRQLLFGIIQGGIIRAAREKSANELLELGFPGYALGGLSVGEGPNLLNEVLQYLVPGLPEEKPRYLMGVGTPEDIWDAVAQGIDMFDCAMPTRIARNGTLYTARGRLVIRNARYSRDESAPDPECECLLCRNHSRAYLRHLFHAHEITALGLSTLHNLTFMLKLTELIKNAIVSDTYVKVKNEFLKKYHSEDLNNPREY